MQSHLLTLFDLEHLDNILKSMIFCARSAIIRHLRSLSKGQIKKVLPHVIMADWSKLLSLHDYAKSGRLLQAMFTYLVRQLLVVIRNL